MDILQVKRVDWVLDFVVRILSGFLKLIYHICTLFPEKSRWVLISRQSNDVPLDFQMISQWCRDQDPPIDVVVLAKQLHNPVTYIPEMLRQTFYIATSKAIVLDSYCITVSLLNSTIKAPVIQIWHALGNMKKFGFASFNSEEGRSPEIARIMHMHEGYDAIAVSSSSFRDDFAAGFNANPEMIFEAPLPRTDMFIDGEKKNENRTELIEQFPQLSLKRNIVYCPTFRTVPSENAQKAMSDLVDSIDFSRYNLIFKPHPISTQEMEDPRVVTIRNNDPDPLFAADYVISDYSTVIYEAGLMGVPVYLYAYDWDSYSQKRGMNIDLEHDVPTLFIHDPKKIMEAIENDEFDHEAYRAFTLENVAIPEGKSCTENLCEQILELAEKV